MGSSESQMREHVREGNRIMRRACDQVQGQMRQLNREDRKLKQLLSSLVGREDMEIIKIHVKDRVRVKRQRIRTAKQLSQLKSLQLEMNGMGSTLEMAKGMKRFGKALRAAERCGINMGGVVQDFERHRQKMQLAQETLDMEEDEEEEVVDLTSEEEKQMLDQILAEAGLRATEGLGGVIQGDGRPAERAGALKR